MSEPTTESLDSGQYTAESIRRYERVFGRDFISPGGADTAREFVFMLELGSGARVLDAGCGIGGAAFLMAREHGAMVEGIDLSANMIDRAAARCRALKLEHQVSFRQANLFALDTDARFDAVYSRDVFMHVEDKRALFEVLRNALKVGGRLLFTDYCRGEKPASEEFERYVADRGYHLASVSGYEQVLKGAGFTRVRAMDLTQRFAEILARELKVIEDLDENAEELSEMAGSWKVKRARALKGEQRWGLFTATKPA